MSLLLVEARDISVDHRVHNVSLTLNQGEVLGLLGPNGAGKSTLLHALAGVERRQGSVRIAGQDEHSLSPKARARLVGLLPQATQSAWSLRVEDIVSLGRLPWDDNDSAAIERAISRTEIGAFIGRQVDELSGGERARVWLARVLAGEPQVLLADEPIASLDIHYQLSVMNVLQAYARDGHGVIVALHDLGLAARYCDRVCLLDKGGLVASGTPQQVFTEKRLAQVYGVAVEVDWSRHPPLILPK